MPNQRRVWCKDTSWWWGRGGERTCHSANESYNTLQAGSVSGSTKGRCEGCNPCSETEREGGTLGTYPARRCRCLIPPYLSLGEEGERSK